MIFHGLSWKFLVEPKLVIGVQCICTEAFFFPSILLVSGHFRDSFGWTITQMQGWRSTSNIYNAIAKTRRTNRGTGTRMFEDEICSPEKSLLLLFCIGDASDVPFDPFILQYQATSFIFRKL